MSVEVKASRYLYQIASRGFRDASDLTGIKPRTLVFGLVVAAVSAVLFGFLTDWTQAAAKFQWQFVVFIGSIIVLVCFFLPFFIAAPFWLHRELIQSHNTALATATDEVAELRNTLQRQMQLKPQPSIEQRELIKYRADIQQLLTDLRAGSTKAANTFDMLDRSVSQYVQRAFPGYTRYSDAYPVRTTPQSYIKATKIECDQLAAICEDRIARLSEIIGPEFA